MSWEGSDPSYTRDTRMPKTNFDLDVLEVSYFIPHRKRCAILEYRHGAPQ